MPLRRGTAESSSSGPLAFGAGGLITTHRQPRPQRGCRVGLRGLHGTLLSSALAWCSWFSNRPGRPGLPHLRSGELANPPGAAATRGRSA